MHLSPSPVPAELARRRLGSAGSAPSTGDAGAVDSDPSVLEGRIVNGSGSTLDEAGIDAVLDRFLDDGNGRLRLVPLRTADPREDDGDLSPSERDHRRERARARDDLRAAAWATGTLEAYAGHVKAWRVWCREQGVPALPFDPEQVANHLMDYAFAWDHDTNDWQRDEDGGMLPLVAAGTVGSRLAALNRCAEFVGTARPGDHPRVKELMRGIRRRLLVAPQHRKEALDLALLRRCLAAASGDRLIEARNACAVLLRACLGATAGQLAALEWTDVELSPERATVRLAPQHRNGSPVERVAAATPGSDACVVEALTTLAALSGGNGRVIAHPDGRPLTRQGVHLLVEQEAAPLGGWRGLPTAPRTALAGILPTTHRSGTLSGARDRALLLVGWYTALRRGNLSRLNWGDLNDHGANGLSARITRSKTDQEGRGRTSWIPQADEGSETDCPASALREWHRQLTTALGREPAPHEPVFVSVTGHGTLKLSKGGRPARLTGDGINEAVQRLTVAAGLVPPRHERAQPATGRRRSPRRTAENPFGAHSMRAGFVTEALRGSKLSIPETKEVTFHVSTEVLMEYHREVNAPWNNASRKLLGRLSES